MATKTKKTAVKKTATQKARKSGASKSPRHRTFKVNEKVVYSIYGVGTVQSIEKRMFNDKKEDHYIISLLTGGMNVIIPVKNSKKVGLRPVINSKDVNRILTVLKSKPSKMDDDWKARYQLNLEKIKTGSIFEVADVAKNYHKRNREKELSIMEKKLYETACQLIVNEVAVVRNIDREEAERLIFDTLG